jgi:hypothetical protein
MFRKFNKVLMITLLTISLSVALGNEAKSALRVTFKGINCYNPVCFDCVLWGLGNARGADAILYADITAVGVLINCNNPGDKNLTTKTGVPHVLTDTIPIAEEQIDFEQFTNGHIEIEGKNGLCYEEWYFENIVQSKLADLNGTGDLCKDTGTGWYWNQDEGYELIEYYATVIFEMETTDRWILELRVWPDGEGCYNYEILSETLIR